MIADAQRPRLMEYMNAFMVKKVNKQPQDVEETNTAETYVSDKET